MSIFFITLVGTHVSALPEETLNIDKRVDAIARYEYDYTLLDLAKTLETQGNLRKRNRAEFSRRKQHHSQPRKILHRKPG